MFAALSENNAFFRGKINIAIMLAPVTRVDRLTSSAIQRLKENESLLALMERNPELFSSAQTEGMFSSGFFKITGIHNVAIACFSDEDTSLISPTGLETFMGHYPAGTSFRSINHFKQILNQKKFQKYDFGKEENLKKYNQEEPPEYDLTKVKGVPIALFCGLKDQLASPLDYHWLMEHLLENNTTDDQTLIYFKEFNLGHMGFLVPPNRQHFYEMLELCKAYNPYYDVPVVLGLNRAQSEETGSEPKDQKQ